MTPRKDRVTFSSGDIRLEGILGHPAGTTRAPGIVVCHPHPQMGGSMDNNVVRALFDGFLERGFRTLAFNFRGTGRSGGAHEGGTGEVQDALAALDFLEGRPEHDGGGLGLLGYSFGAWVVLHAAAAAGARVRCTGAVAPPVTMLPFDFLDGVPGPLYFVWGDSDPFCPWERAERILSACTAPWEARRLARTDHFLLGREREAAAYLCDRFSLHLRSRTSPADA